MDDPTIPSTPTSSPVAVAAGFIFSPGLAKELEEQAIASLLTAKAASEVAASTATPQRAGRNAPRVFQRHVKKLGALDLIHSQVSPVLIQGLTKKRQEEFLRTVSANMAMTYTMESRGVRPSKKHWAFTESPLSHEYWHITDLDNVYPDGPIIPSLHRVVLGTWGHCKRTWGMQQNTIDQYVSKK